MLRVGTAWTYIVILARKGTFAPLIASLVVEFFTITMSEVFISRYRRWNNILNWLCKVRTWPACSKKPPLCLFGQPQLNSTIEAKALKNHNEKFDYLRQNLMGSSTSWHMSNIVQKLLWELKKVAAEKVSFEAASKLIFNFSMLQVLELQNTLDDLTSRVDAVKVSFQFLSQVSTTKSTDIYFLDSLVLIVSQWLHLALW